MTRWWMVTAVGLLLPSVALARDDDRDGWHVPDDCDDADPTVYPGAPELLNGRDDDCDGVVDEGYGTTTRDTGDGDEADVDMDGWSTPDDCDDADPTVHPGAPETANGRDDDCDGEVDEGLGTAGTGGAGDEVCGNGVDDDDDGLVDEDCGTTGDTGGGTADDGDTGEPVEGSGTGCIGTGGSYALLLLPLGLLGRRGARRR